MLEVKGVKAMGKECYGVPLGGIGTGAMELCGDGRFRNISINNNRLPESHIAKAEHTFIAIRIGSAKGVYARMLQHSVEGESEEAGAPPRMRRDLLHWRGAYPAVHYKVKDVDCPAEVVWTAFAPLIPFDYDASTMPAIFCSVRFANQTDETLAVSAVFNWEDLGGRIGTYIPAETARIMPLVVDEQEDGELLTTPESAPDGTLLFNAVEFGSHRDTFTNAHGQYCLAARRKKGVNKVTAVAWDSNSPEDREIFWERFLEQGDLTRCVPRSPKKRSGAVCCSYELLPQQECRADFVLTWFCPRNDIHGMRIGNGYTNKFPNAVEIARKGLRHLVYFFTAVEEWQKRIRNSSLPSWFSRLLVNSAQIFCTNSIYARDGRVCFMESPQYPGLGRLDIRLYASFGAMLFFPRFEENELQQIARASGVKTPARLCADLGASGYFEPRFDDAGGGQVERCVHFVLSAYRNYVLIGSLPRLQELLPAARAAMASVLMLDQNGDGIPEISESVTYDGIKVTGLNAYAAGLWVAAMRAYAHLMRTQGQLEEAAWYEEAYKRAAVSYEQLFWDEQGGYYRLGRTPSEAVCHSAQLAGQWYADFLGLGTLFQRNHILRALDSLLQHVPQGGANAVSNGQGDEVWPGFEVAHLVCLLLYRGRAEDALRLLEGYAAAFNYQQCTPFNFPNKWDVGKNALAPDGLGRHLSALSLWHVLYAIQGLELNVPEQALRVTPRLLPGWHTLNAPIFTPICLGWLQYTEDVMKPYRQHVHVSFDSPVIVKTLELCVPNEVNAVQVRCEDVHGILDVTHRLIAGSHAKRVIITARQPVTVLDTLSVNLEGRG